MELNEIKEKISAIIQSGISSQLYFVIKTGDDTYGLKLADIEDQSTEPAIRKLFIDGIQSFISSDDLSVCNLSAADDRRKALFYYDYEEYPDELKLLKDFDIGKTVKSTPKFNFTLDDLSKVRGYIVYLGTMESGLVLYKQHYPISLIKRGSFLLGAIKSRERFEQIPGEDMIRLNSDVQLLKLKDELYVIDLKVLEKNLGFTKLIQKESDEMISKIESLGIIEDVQVLRDSAENISFARKLARVKASSPILKLSIPKEEVIEFSKTSPGLKGKFKYTDDEKTIRLDTNASKDAFIKLLNDAYLYSKLTKQNYEARSKDSIPNKP